MRKQHIFFLVATIVLSTSCNVEVPSVDTPMEHSGSNTLSITLPAATRTSMGPKSDDEYPMYWSEGDCIAVNGIASSSISINEKDPRKATFSFNDNVLTYPYQIIFPYNEANSIEEPKVIFPEKQNHVEGSFSLNSVPMFGYIENRKDGLFLQHLACILRFEMLAEVEDIELATITITSESGKRLSGEFSVDMETGEIRPTANTSSKITYYLPEGYTLSTEESNVFYISIPAVTLGSCTIVFTTTNGCSMQTKWNSSKIEPGVVREFKAFTFKQDSEGYIQEMKGVDDSFLHRYPTIFGYVRDTEGNPIEGVVVSDGFSVTTTNHKGFYYINVLQDAWYIFISVPSEYKIPINRDGQPCFFKPYPGYSEFFNFTLEKLPEGKENEFMLFAFADPQTGGLSAVNRFSKQVAPEIKSYSASLGKPCYGITLGDVISMGSTDISKDVLPAMRAAMHIDYMGMPVFQVMGNHDNCFMSTKKPVKGKDIREINLNIQRMFEDAFGPINYSFNRGDAHIVGMRNVQWKSGDNCATANTRTAFTEDQYNWLVADLAQVPKDKIVILCVHVPLYNNGSIGDGSYRQEILTLLDDFAEAHVLSGHLHYQRNYDHTASSTSSHKIYEHAQAAVNGASWSSNINGDGVPNGYGVYHFDGNTIKDWYYKGYAKGMDSRDYQIRLYRGNAITGAQLTGSDSNGTKGYYQFGYSDDTLLANVFNSDSQWKVEVYENGVYSGNMTSLAAYHWDITYNQLIGSGVYDDPKRPPVGAECGRDFWAVGVLCGYLGRNNGGLYYKHCYQLWKYKLKNKKSKVEVRATDRKGNVYTCSTITEGTDMTYALYTE